MLVVSVGFSLEGLDFDNLLLVAGGVGIAPILSIMEDLAGNPAKCRFGFSMRETSAQECSNRPG
ncbi:hypothetical protein [Labrenzia sp. MBR-25]|jgi:NAD(P)H-flavin reductase